jgi:hypothetical protein
LYHRGNAPRLQQTRVRDVESVWCRRLAAPGFGSSCTLVHVAIGSRHESNQRASGANVVSMFQRHRAGEISLKSKMNFYCCAIVVRSYPPMAAARRTNATVPVRNARPDQHRRRPARSRSSRSRRHELQAKAMRIGVVLSLFVVLIVAAVFIGGRSVIGPMLQEAMAQRVDLHRKGAIVFTMPDGSFCRHLAYDNKTAELTESAVVQCPEARSHEAARPPSGFAWGAQ